MATIPRGYWARKHTANDAMIRKLQPTDTQTTPGKTSYTYTAGDGLTLRGIPAIGRNVPGAIARTRPDKQKYLQNDG